MAATYVYRAKNRQGESIKGTIKAESRNEVADIVRQQGYYVVAIDEKKDINLKKIMRFFQKIKSKDLAILSRQFAVLIRAGVPIVECLDILLNQFDKKNIKEVLQGVLQHVSVGTSFSEALERQENVFPQMYYRMVQAGEIGGMLDVVMGRLAEYYERETDRKSKIKAAMMYPIVVLLLAITVVVFLLTSVVPVFAQLFSSMGHQLPTPTRIVLGASRGIVHYWFIILLAIGGLTSLIFSYLKSPSGRYRFHRFQLRIPVIGDLIIKVEVSKLTRTLSSLLKSGIPLMDALKVVERVVSNQIITDNLTQARQRVGEGTRLSEPLGESNLFPRMMVQMLGVGEETGTMDDMLENIANFYDKEAENGIKGLMALVEPAMIVIIAILVGFIVVAMVLPMFDIMNLF